MSTTEPATQGASARTPPVYWGRIAQATLLAALASAAVNAVLRAVAVAVLDIPQPGFHPLALGPVLTSSVVGAIGAGLVFALLVRFVRRPVRVFRLLAAVVFVLSLSGPLSLLGRFPGADGATVAVLALMHVVVAAISVALVSGGRQELAR